MSSATMRCFKPLLMMGAAVLILTACQPTAQPVQEPTVAAEEPTAVPTPTALPERTLTVCLSQEPATLYPYGGSSTSMWSVLEALYDGPFDMLNNSVQPVILEKMPSLADGDAQLLPVDVSAGDEIVDAAGNLAVLDRGVVIRPSGCTASSCAVEWDGSSPLQMDQLQVTFKLLPDLKWSDGTSLKASDSVYSYNVAANSETPVSKDAILKTVSYLALDDQNVTWTGKAGYFPQQYNTMFWLPLPEHLWGALSPAELLTADLSSRSPIGWGPFVIESWVPGDHIELVKNPNYFRADQGLPKLDRLVYRFLGEETDNNLAALLTGECDVVDQNTLTDAELETAVDLQKNGKLNLYVGVGPEWEHVDFGIKPAAYDDGYNPYQDLRPDYFSDVRVRQAFAYCIDRQQINDRWLQGLSAVPASYLTPSHPAYDADIIPLPFDPAEGSRLLDEVGWKNLTGDPLAPREAVGVANVPDGTKLSVNFATTEAVLRVKIAELMAESMAQCGIQLNVQYYTPGDLYAAGPDGILFGRNFDLAEFSWKSGTQSPCRLYETSQIPDAANQWIGTNVTGYSNPEYDAACQAASEAQIGQDESALDLQKAVQQKFAQDLPVIPLYYRLQVAASRVDLCGLNLDVSARSALWNLEQIDYGENCP